MIEVILTLDSTDYDVSPFLLDIGTIERKVESDNAHEPGLIVFDNVSMEISLIDSNIADLFSETNLKDQLDSYGIPINYITVNIRKQIDGTWYQMFNGIIDYESVEWTDTDTVTFVCLDKLSAVGLSYESPCRETMTLLPDRDYSTTQNADAGYRSINTPNTATFYLMNGSNYLDLEQQLFLTGEIFSFPDEFVNRIVTKSELGDFGSGHVGNKITFYPEKDNYISGSFANLSFYGRDFLGININTVQSDDYSLLESFDLFKIFVAIVKNKLPDIQISGEFFSAFPHEAFSILTTTTFDKHPLDAVKYIASILRCYVFINKDGDLVIKKYEDMIAQTPTTFSAKPLTSRNRFFWDKVIDEVEIKGRTFENGVFETILDGAVVKQRTGTNKIKPKNRIEKDLIVYPMDSMTAEETANAIAQDYIDFYGKRRSGLSQMNSLDSETAQFDLTESKTIGSKDYFLLRLAANLTDETLDMEFVEI